MTRFRFTLVAACLALCGAVAAQDAGPKRFRVTVPYDGPELFARLLDHAGLKPIADPNRLGLDASLDKTVVVVFGDPAPLIAIEETVDGGVRGFLKRGGALLVATDRRFSFRDLPSLRWDDVQTTEGDLVNFTQNFENQPQCPTILKKEIRRPDHPLFADVAQPIATNCPGSLSFEAAPLEALAHLPPGTASARVRLLVPELLENAPAATRRYLAVSTDKSERAVLVAGHGLFTNCMTVREDLDNRRLALNAIGWLKDGMRTHAMFFHEGKPVTKFTMPLAGPPRVPPPTIELINRVIDSVQNSGVIERLADRIVGPENFVRGVIVLGTLLLLLYGAKKFFQSRWTLEATPAIVGMPPPTPVPLERRRIREMVSRDQLGEPARSLARDWFRAYANVDFPAGGSPAALTFEIRGGALQRRKLAKHVESLWKLATESPPANWSPKKFRDLAIFLEELSLATSAGELTFDRAGATSGRA